MALTIDQLEIQILAETANASRGINRVKKYIQSLNTALGEFNTKGTKVVSTFKGVSSAATSASTGLQRYNKTQKQTRTTFQETTDKMAQQISKWRTLFGVFRAAANTMASWYKESNNYIETLNLFNVTMGEAADAATNYARKVQDLMGIDIAEWMNYQGTFKQLTAGFGVAEEAANTMSTNLTQLSYDLSSFFNTSVETAFDKLSSAMAGQVKGLRQFGIDTTVASLQEYALAKGIETSVRSMTQAEKSLLRYNYIMEKSVLIQGDMARTILTPANALRVLNSQLTQMKRAFGNIVSVLVTQIIPYVQVFVQIITEAAQALATFFGFELPTIDYSGLDTGGGLAEEMEDAEESTGGVSDKLKEIKKQLMGFDEINIINDPDKNSGSGSGGVGSGLGGGLNMEPLEYDFLGNLKTGKLDEIKEKLKDILTTVGLITAGITAWKLYNFWKHLDTTQQKLVGLTLMITGFTLTFEGMREIGNGTANMWDYIKTALGAALGIGGSLIVFGTGPLGWTIGIVGTIAIGIIGFSIGYNEKQIREDIEKRFGELELDEAEISDWAAKLTASDLSIKIGLYVDEVKALADLEKGVNTALKNLQKLNFRASIGLKVDEASYKTAIDEYINSATEYLTSRQMTAQLAVDIIYGDSATGDRLSGFVTEFYTSTQAQLSTLGAKLKQTVSEGFVDGVWIEDKMQEAIKLQQEIQEILDYTSRVEYEAKLSAIKLDASNMDITAESFQGIMDQANATVAQQLENLEGVRLEAIKIAKMEFDQNILNGMSEEAAKQIYDSAVEEADKKFRNSKLELTYGTVDFGIGIIKEKFATELEIASPVFGSTLQDALKNGFLTGVSNPEEIYSQPVSILMADLDTAYRSGIANLDISPAARKNMEELVVALQPTKAEYEEIAKSARAAGETVPEYVSQGLSDIKAMEAVAGNAQAINYKMGEMLSTDPSFIDTLATAEGAGTRLNDEVANGLLNNLQVVEDAANGTVTLIGDEIGEKTYEITPTLIKNMQDLGVNLSDGLLSGAETEQEKNKKSWLDWAIWPWNWFKKENEINSPSKLFARGGRDIVQGLWNGLKEVWNSLTRWWDNLSLSQMDFKLPHFTWYTTPADGWIAKTLDALGLPTSLPKLSISWYASGGFPNMGEMFIARESGPELVGRIGNKTTVANNDQIIAGIESGVYRAMVAANSGGGNQTIRIINEIDGDVVGEKVIRYHNGIVMQTGESPLLA